MSVYNCHHQTLRCNNSVVDGHHNYIIGNNNSITGHHHDIRGDNNNITGHHHKVNGNNNNINGHHNDVRGQNNNNFDEQVTCSGNNVSVGGIYEIGNVSGSVINTGYGGSFIFSDGEFSDNFMNFNGSGTVFINGKLIGGNSQNNNSSINKVEEVKLIRIPDAENEATIDSDEIEQKDLCSICLERRNVAAIIDCGHRCLCITCSQSYKNKERES